MEGRGEGSKLGVLEGGAEGTSETLGVSDGAAEGSFVGTTVISGFGAPGFGALDGPKLG